MINFAKLYAALFIEKIFLLMIPSLMYLTLSRKIITLNS